MTDVTICLMGPTASGKTELVLELAQRLPLEVVNVDAAQVYRGLDVGTAKPTHAQRERVPHALVDVCDAAEAYSVARFRADALVEIDRIHQRGHIPVLAGGTIFYFHALEYGLSPLPGADPIVRQRLNEEAADLGWPALHERLKRLDPGAASRIEPLDRQRIQRALEVIEITGLPMQRFAARETAAVPHRLVKIAVAPADRAVLHERINARFQRMLASGLIEESQWLFARTDLPPQAPALRLVGYRQVGEYLRGKINYNELVLRGCAATRQLAKRQLTWLRHYQGVQWFDGHDKGLVHDVEAFIRACIV